jgi:hypothetical protein
MVYFINAWLLSKLPPTVRVPKFVQVANPGTQKQVLLASSSSSSKENTHITLRCLTNF